jgi:hypothetical protein
VIANGWQVSGITTFQGGFPGNVSVGFTGIGGELNRVYTGSENVAPRVALAGDPGAKKQLDSWIDTSVFRAPVIGSTGLESARYVVRRPGINNWDISIFKNFPVSDIGRFQFRWELYNAFNHAQFQGVDTTARFDPAGNQVNGRFGALTSTGPGRVMQGSLRFSF